MSCILPPPQFPSIVKWVLTHTLWWSLLYFLTIRCFFKVNEIAFINTLEAQNKKIEVLTRHQVWHKNAYKFIHCFLLYFFAFIIVAFRYFHCQAALTSKCYYLPWFYYTKKYFDFGRAMKQGYKTFRYFKTSSKFWLFGNTNMASFCRRINKKSVSICS